MDDLLPLTVCIITYNEEDHIADCLESVSFARDIVVVDSFSTDRTEDLCQSGGPRVRFYQHRFEGHVQQKNIALQKAKEEWVLALDADERVSPSMLTAIRSIFREGPAADGYSFRRVTSYLGRWIRHGAFYPDRKIRLFRKDCARWGGENPHDRIILSGKVLARQEEILHYSYDDLADHIRTLNNFSSIQARNIFLRNPPASDRWIVTRMASKSLWVLFVHLFVRRGILDGRSGIIIAVFSAFAMFARYAKVYEQALEQRQRDPH